MDQATADTKNFMSHDHTPIPIVWQKRIFDIAVSLFFLVLTAPLFVLFLVLIFVEHCLRGYPLDPLFYTEYRVSRGVQFKIFKFNIFDQRIVDTFRKQEKFIHTKDLEQRGEILCIGFILKQIYLDELPQLINVLRGDMSLVGPRPLNPEVFARVAANAIPPQALLTSGMTGNFQSLKDTKGVTARELEANYIYYYTHKNGWLLIAIDIRIILRTFKVLLRAKGL